MRWKKRWIALGVLAGSVAYGSYNFKEDRLLMRTIISHASVGDVYKTIEMMEENRFLANPLLNVYFQVKKRQCRARFVDLDEEFDSISSNPKVDAIVGLYRQYWNDKLLKREGDAEEKLWREMALVVGEPEDPKQDRSRDSIATQMVDVITAEGLYVTPFFLNGTYGLKIWEEQTVENYHIELPDENIDVEVVLIEKYLLRGYNNYATLGAYNDGGWVSTNKRVYCNTGEYNFGSEKFLVSFLKHEGLHFADILQYPNLEGADLEYRSKLVELMYSTEGRICTLLENFTLNSSGKDRAFSHAYANHHLLQTLSRTFFDSEYNGDAEQWKSIPCERINAAAKELYEASREHLAKDPEVREVI